MPIPGSRNPYLRGAADLGQDAQQTAGPRRNLNPEFHCERIRPVLVEGLPHRCDHPANRLGESRQAQRLSRRRNPFPQPNVRRASGLLTGRGWPGCLYANPYQLTAGQRDPGDLRRSSSPISGTLLSFECTSSPAAREDHLSVTSCCPLRAPQLWRKHRTVALTAEERACGMGSRADLPELPSGGQDWRAVDKSARTDKYMAKSS